MPSVLQRRTSSSLASIVSVTCAKMSTHAVPLASENGRHALLIREDQSWLAFNERVLSEAENADTPLYERIKFLSIFLSNLDEFFMVKVGPIHRESERLVAQESHRTCDDPLPVLRRRLNSEVKRVNSLYEKELLPELADSDVQICTLDTLSARQSNRLRKTFVENILGLLTPLIIDKAHPFPFFENQRCYLLVQLKAKNSPLNTYSYGVVQLPSSCGRFVRLTDKNRSLFVYLEDAIVQNVDQIFPWASVVRSAVIRVTRNRELTLLDDQFDDMLESVEQGLRNKTAKQVVRLETSQRLPVSLKQFLMRHFEIEGSEIFEYNGRLVTQELAQLIPSGPHPNKDPVFHPATTRRLKRMESPFEVIREGDIWMHHPYDSFTDTLHFLEAAASDPRVVSIKQTLYRTGNNSPVASALLRAAEAGKQVVAIIELTARFDEQRNVSWAKKLRQAGATVVFGIEGWKTHCKMTLVVRREGTVLQSFAHVSTGNYNAKTAQIYTDLSLLTANPEITADVATLFNTLTGLPKGAGISSVFSTHFSQRMKVIKVAPFGLREFFAEKIDHEIREARCGKQARIALKLNSLTDPELIAHLYTASCAGVKIELLIRGMCRLQAGVRGVSQNIRVVSVIDRFLEHSRIYCFGTGPKSEVFVGSADFMPRNMNRRVECVWPVQDQKGKEKIQKILNIGLADNVKAHEMQPDGSYARVRKKGRESIQSQSVFIEWAQKRTEQ